MQQTIDITLLAEQMVVLDYLLDKRNEALPVLSFKPDGWPHRPLIVRDALLGLRNLGDAMQFQIERYGTVVLKGVVGNEVQENDTDT